MADVAIVKGETPAGDRTWLSFPDGTAHRAAVHVSHDLPHLVVESVFGLPDGLWGTLAAGGFEPAARELTKRRSHIRLVTDAPLGELGTRNWPAHKVAKAAVNAVLNRWGDGPDTPAGVRDRLRGCGRDGAELADELDDDSIMLAAAGVRRLYREWAALPAGGTLRLTWPLHDSWLRLVSPVLSRVPAGGLNGCASARRRERRRHGRQREAGSPDAGGCHQCTSSSPAYRRRSRWNQTL